MPTGQSEAERRFGLASLGNRIQGSSVVIYEFQKEGADGEWEALGLSRVVSDELDLGEAIAALRATRELEQGSYRVRAVEDERRWHFGEVDGAGDFRLLDEPPA
jgi:hypothetical protein